MRIWGWRGRGHSTQKYPVFPSDFCGFVFFFRMMGKEDPQIRFSLKENLRQEIGAPGLVGR